MSSRDSISLGQRWSTAMTAERQRRPRERLKEQGLPVDSSQAKGVAYIWARCEAGSDQWEVTAALGIRTEAHLWVNLNIRRKEE